MLPKDESFFQESLCRTVNQDEQTEHLLCKLRKVFKDGYRPARSTESYNCRLNNHVKAYTMVNCLGHVLNLRNEQFNDYEFKPYKMYGYFSGIGTAPKEIAADRMFDFIKDIGLKIEECDPSKPIDDFKSWKIALYFQDNKWRRDFHYLLEERPSLWSSKIGFKPCVEHIYETKPPENYRNLVDTYPFIYNFFGTYKITNPNANANNRYLKQFALTRNTTQGTFPLQHYLAEDGRKDSFNQIIEEFTSSY